MQENLVVIKTVEELKMAESTVLSKDYISFDIETTGLGKDSEIIGFSFASGVETGYYVVLSYWDVALQKLQYLETKEYAKEFLMKLSKKSLVMHNGIFDCSMIEHHYNIKLIDSLFHDTMISGHLLNENRSNGLKERAVELYGEDMRIEQFAMKESVAKNGGVLTKANYELYKADADLIAHYGCKDAILTLKLFYEDVPQLFEEQLAKFFYEEESMPLLRGPTYQLNTSGLKINTEGLILLKKALELECEEFKRFIYKEIEGYIKDEYPGTSKNTTFNIGSSKQLAWLLFFRLGNDFHVLTKGGKELCKALNIKIPYSNVAKRDFKNLLINYKDRIFEPEKFNVKLNKMSRSKKVGAPWNYVACGKETLEKFQNKYKWVKTLLDYSKALKLLNTYVAGIEGRMQYNIIRPSFLQHGTTSGRYSSRNPNFQNLPKKDKRIKDIIIARPGKVFVGADYSQLEPRVFASFSKDKRLLDCFSNGDDFYSVIGAEVFGKSGYSLKKDDKNSFAELYPDLRDISKIIALSSTYGTTAPKMAPALNMSIEEAQNIINDYFEKFPQVKDLMLTVHSYVKENGFVKNLFGRPRRIPKAKNITSIYGNTKHSELPYEVRNMLNLAINHMIQSTGASIMNRAAISVFNKCKDNPKYSDIRIVLQIHDELVLEGPESLAQDMIHILKDSMENSVKLPGVKLIAEPKVGKTLAQLK